ncbi:VacJ family lipoprotein [Pseudomonas sp. P1B16]|jgi:Surface lipoprotein|uniref:VacJ family lipoprotein n=1 Tax=Pseudomonas capeferrum TaxID=1495066 RepID=A0ABY7RDH0_9PSED|nr:MULTISPECIES: VacJ family lipoprotein [Pseudomonas]KEY86597.1 membrane protein [Pseudomonas capeferrum]MBC3479919.1 VacJ family lipoprotein [Pseudomonas sp. SWRI77]MBC3502745.1 VacJ family lipoprotein [Pseudomonas sp. SWRI59]MBC3508115.1 VacJ family lipoprotein [Pseudomonas sp. SWRI68]MCH7302547.1 VacJ family lipoprotein [Pseudomonas capeferrum]
MRRIGAGVIERVTQACVCASLLLAPVAATQAATEDDPWEAVNRPIFRFNDTVDTYALKPLAKGYEAVTPQFLEDGIHNVFRNLGDVTNLVNNVLQLKPHAAGVDTARLIVNTTFGIGGFFDVGTKMGLQRSDEDFGQTLGYWGVGSGPYVVIPLLGPSTVRDGLAKYPDSYTKPYRYIDHVPTRNSIFALDVIDTRASLLPAEKLIQGDKYIFIRNAYLQNREFKVKDGEVEDDF